MRVVKLVLVALALSAVAAAPASAVEFTVAEGGSFTVNWLCGANCQWDPNGGYYLPLTAEGTFTVDSVNDGYALVSVSVQNTWISDLTTLNLPPLEVEPEEPPAPKRPKNSMANR